MAKSTKRLPKPTPYQQSLDSADSVLGWHILPANKRTNYYEATLVRAGKLLSYPADRNISACNCGYHSCEALIDALEASDHLSTITRVVSWGDIDSRGAKIAARNRLCLALWSEAQTRRIIRYWLADTLKHYQRQAVTVQRIGFIQRVIDLLRYGKQYARTVHRLKNDWRALNQGRHDFNPSEKPIFHMLSYALEYMTWFSLTSLRPFISNAASIEIIGKGGGWGGNGHDEARHEIGATLERAFLCCPPADRPHLLSPEEVAHCE